MTTKEQSTRWAPFLMRFGMPLHPEDESGSLQVGRSPNSRADPSPTSMPVPVGVTRKTGVGRETTDDD
jgi:hypothetical protein